MIEAKPSGNARRSWHVRANGVVFVYALLGLITLVAPLTFDGHRWLVVHLFLLGSATNAIVAWTEHFTVTLLRVPQPSRKFTAWRLWALNVAVVTSLVGVSLTNDLVIVIGASALTIVVGLHLRSLYRLSKRALQNRFAGTARFYLAAGLCLVLGIALGVLAAFQSDGSRLRDSLHVAHVHANIFGWVGLTVIGTLFTFWPTVLRTRIVDGVMNSAKRSLRLLLPGVLAAALALSVHQRFIALVGVIAYATGICIAAAPFMRTWKQKRPHDFAAFAIFFATSWLLLGVVSDTFALAFIGDMGDYASWLDRVVPAFLFGFVGQILLGALTFLVPVILGGGPAAVRDHIERLGTRWKLRLAVFNVGTALTIVSGAFARLGYGLLALSLAVFIALVIVSVRSGVRRTDDQRGTAV